MNLNFLTGLAIKNWLENRKRGIAIFLLLFLISSLSFGLGYLYARDNNRVPIIIETGD